MTEETQNENLAETIPANVEETNAKNNSILTKAEAVESIPVDSEKPKKKSFLNHLNSL